MKIKSIKYKRIQTIVFLVVGLLFLIVNIIASQLVSPLMVKLLENPDENTVALYLQKIRTLPLFDDELFFYQNMYGETINDKVFRVEKERRTTISQLEELLRKNPQARDVLYNLSKLYQAEGNTAQADIYLQKAKAIDPFVGE